jgi:hypothetical protein
MKNKINIQADTAPSIYVTKNKKRIKQYDNLIYLNNGDEFELELFNPTTNKILAEIELNGNSIGNGLILRPGERVFLERFLNAPKKFLFETYMINGDDYYSQQAIKNNGDVSVKFYKEKIPISHKITEWTYFPYSFHYCYKPYWLQDPFIYHEPANICRFQTYSSNVSSQPIGENILNNYTSYNTYSLSENQIETGRIEHGDNSNQNLIPDSTEFESFHSWSKEWKILPKSQKSFTKDDIKIYCENCGTKRKKDTYKYCQICGMKFK